MMDALEGSLEPRVQTPGEKTVQALMNHVQRQREDFIASQEDREAVYMWAHKAILEGVLQEAMVEIRKRPNIYVDFLFLWISIDYGYGFDEI